MGLTTDLPGILLRTYLRYLLMGVLLLTCIKADFSKVLNYTFSPHFIIYLSLMKLFIIPLIFYYTSLILAPQYALGIFILSAMPSAMVCATLSDVASGNIEAALSGTIYTTLLCSLTLPLLVNTLHQETMEYYTIFSKIKYLLLTIAVPMAAATGVKNLFSTTVKRFSSMWTPLSIIVASTITMVAISANRTFILQNWQSLLSLLPFMIFSFALSLFMSYYLFGFFYPKDVRIAFAINISYVNNGLAIVFIMEFFTNQFGPEIILPSFLIEVPMSFMILPLRYLTNSRT